MKLDEAIKHLEEKIDNEFFCWPSEECRQEHEQLLGWMKELKELRLENDVSLRRLKHLLESNYISQFDQVDPNTHEYIRNIRDADWKVMYLCDQEKPCKEHCEKDHHCKRTSDISHAKNFRLVPNGMYPIVYEEVDEHCIANITFDREQLQEIVDEKVIKPIKNGELVVKTEEKPHGEWLEIKTNPPEFFGHKFYMCSKCGREIDVITPDESLDDYPYCHCGACMIKEAENEEDKGHN